MRFRSVDMVGILSIGKIIKGFQIHLDNLIGMRVSHLILIGPYIVAMAKLSKIIMRMASGMIHLFLILLKNRYVN